MTEIRKVIEEVKTVKTSVFIAMECDVCHNQFKNQDWERGGVYTSCDTEISYELRTNYPEGGYKERKTLDICPDCLNDVFLYLEQKGATIRDEESSL